MCNLTDYKNMWVFIETECGKAKNVGYELLNVAKLNELKHNNTISLIFNDYAIKKYMKTHSDEAVEEVSSSTSSKFKVGLIDKTLWNFDTKYMNTIKSFNKAFNIFYIVTSTINQ